MGVDRGEYTAAGESREVAYVRLPGAGSREPGGEFDDRFGQWVF